MAGVLSKHSKDSPQLEYQLKNSQSQSSNQCASLIGSMDQFRHTAVVPDQCQTANGSRHIPCDPRPRNPASNEIRDIIHWEYQCNPPFDNTTFSIRSSAADWRSRGKGCQAVGGGQGSQRQTFQQRHQGRIWQRQAKNKSRRRVFQLRQVRPPKIWMPEQGERCTQKGAIVVVPGIPGLRAVLDLVTIHPILPPTLHIHPYHG